MKRLIALALFVCMLLAAAPMAIAEEPMTITWLHPNWNVALLDHFSDSLWIKTLEEKFNVKFDFMGVTTADDYNNVVNLAISGDEWPDIIYWDWSNYSGGVAAAIEDGLILPISTNEEYWNLMPNFRALLEENDVVRRILALDDGTIASFSHIEETVKRNAYEGNGIRLDWLENLNLEVPTTIDELYTVLKAFKEQDANGNGDPNDEIPMTDFKSYKTIKNLSGAWGMIVNEMQLDPETGEVTFWTEINDGENFKDFVLTLRKWYQEGLIDPEFASMSNDDMIAKILNNQAGYFFQYPTSVTSYNETIAKDDPDAHIVGLHPMKKLYEKNYTGQNKLVRWIAAEEGSCITTAAEKRGHVEKILEIFDYLYSKEGTELISWGVEGVSFTRDADGNNVWTDAVRNEDGTINSDKVAMYALPTRGQWPRMMSYSAWYSMEITGEDNLQTHENYFDVDTSICIPPLVLVGENSVEYTSIMSEVLTLVGETYIKVILGTADEAELDTMLEQVDKMGIDRAIEISRKTYDQYANK